MTSFAVRKKTEYVSILFTFNQFIWRYTRTPRIGKNRIKLIIFNNLLSKYIYYHT